MDHTQRRRVSLMQQMSELQRQLDQLVDMGDLETYPDDSIIRVEVYLNGSGPFTYVLLKTRNVADVHWYATGRMHGVPASRRWATSSELVSWLTSHGVVVRSWQLMVPASTKDRIYAENAAGETDQYVGKA